jgi:hypothetical protein
MTSELRAASTRAGTLLEVALSNEPSSRSTGNSRTLDLQVPVEVDAPSGDEPAK